MKYMILCFNQKDKQEQLNKFLREIEKSGSYAEPDMDKIYFNVDISGITTIDFADFVLGEKLIDLGFTAYKQIWNRC